jgi:RNA polymerase sigma-70 factor (ECF subfamily)
MTSRGSPMNFSRHVEGARQGKRDDCRALYESASKAVYRQCLLAYRGDVEAARDASQEAWVRIFRGLNQLKTPEAFVSWAVSVATMLCTSRRRLDLRQSALLDRFAVELTLDAPPHDDAERLRREALVREQLEALDDEKQRQLALAVYVEGRTTRETAETLGVPHGTVTVTLMRLRTRLREALARQLTAEGWS